MDDEHGFRLISPAFKDGGNIPSPYTCRGQGVSPPLNIIGAPKDSKSLVLVMHDPDAVNGDFTHWLLWDIAASTDSFAAHSVPVGAIQGKNSAGSNQYLGPCPPAGSGTHRYRFELYALDKSLGLPAGSSRDDLQAAMDGHIMSQAVLIGLFSAEDTSS